MERIPRVYQLVQQQRIQDILRSFNACMALPIQLLDERGKILFSCGEATSYCQMLKRHVFSPESCERLHMDAGRRALQLGEAYIFACHANLNHIAFPLSSGEELLGVILVGPFLMDEPDSTLVSELGRRYRMTSGGLLDLYDELHTVEVVPPAKVGHMSRLLYYLLAPLVPTQAMRLEHNQEKLLQQARINESIQRFKRQGEEPSSAYPYELEKSLMTKVKTGDIQAAKGILNDLLGYVLFSEGYRLDNMKYRSLELCTLLSRIAIEGGALTDATFRLNNRFLSALEHINTLEDICLKLQEIVEAFVETMFTVRQGPGTETIRKAVGYIARHYQEPLELGEVAAHVGLSPSYFSAMFKRLTGSSFKEYLNQVRVEESKQLLSHTEYHLVDIAIAVGFGDQSYFSKVFKKYTGLTPKQYH